MGWFYRRIPLTVWFSVLLFHGASSAVAADEALEQQSRRRRPVAMALAGADRVVVANRIGSLSLIDVAEQRCRSEQQIGQRLTAIAKVGDLQWVVADAGARCLRVIQLAGSGRFQELSSVPIEPEPVSICRVDDRVVVASLWAHRLAIFHQLPDRLERVATIDLEFAPQQLLALGDRRMLVADAFGGWLAEIDIRHEGRVVAQRELRGSHNIDGLACSSDGQTLYLAHQVLNGYEATTGPNVHWGGVMSNVIRRLDRGWLTAETSEASPEEHFLQYLGHPDSATGDPCGLLITRDQHFIVGYAGVDQLGISQKGLQSHYERATVGRRPSDFVLAEDETTLYVANRFDDSVTIVDVARHKPIASISLGPQSQATAVDRGESLFYDARLSSDGWYSCHSCHTNGHSNGGQSDTFGDDYRGSPKQVLSLLGAAETGPWAWNGQKHEIRSQIEKSIETTMRGPTPTDQQLDDLVAYVKSLQVPVSRDEARGAVNRQLLAKGRELFRRLDCVSCHEPSTYTSAEAYDVGLEDEAGGREFNPPSLRGLGHRQRWLHDGTASSLREALQVHPLGEPTQLADDEWAALEAFLMTL